MILGINGIITAGKTVVSTLLNSLFTVYKAENNANDSLGTYNGTAQGGLTYTAGKSGNAFTFNGTNAQVNLPNNSLNSLADTFSVSFWGYYATTSPQVAISNYSSVGGKYGFSIWINIGSGANFMINNQRFNGSTEVAFSCGTMVINQWYHIVMTRNPSSTKIYLNGSLVGSNGSTSTTAYNSSCLPTIGVRPDGFWRSSNGTKIDELNFWTKELTSTEVTELYNAGAGKFYPY